MAPPSLLVSPPAESSLMDVKVIGLETVPETYSVPRMDRLVLFRNLTTASGSTEMALVDSRVRFCVTTSRRLGLSVGLDE